MNAFDTIVHDVATASPEDKAELRSLLQARARRRRERAAASITDADIAEELRRFAFERIMRRRLAELQEQDEAEQAGAEDLAATVASLDIEARATLQHAFERGELAPDHPLAETFAAEARQALVAELGDMSPSERLSTLDAMAGGTRVMSAPEVGARQLHAFIEHAEQNGSDMRDQRKRLASMLAPGSGLAELCSDLTITKE